MSELEYPFGEPPAQGEMLPVADGIHWLRMPLPMALDHINLYALEDEAGWWILDTGMGLPQTREAWETLFDGPMGGRPVAGVIVTHMHPDHLGQAGWLCDKWRVPLYMSFGEYYNGRSFTKMTVDDLNWTTERYFVRAGLGEDFVAQMRERFRGFGAIVEPVPGAFQRLSEGDTLHIGGREWRVMIGRGHSPEHVCLYNERDDILFSGDQIIPRITSNISVMPSEPEANPLEEWFDSLERFRRDLPASTLVLPSHNTPFKGVHQRLEYLIDHHRDHLEALEEACLEPQRALDMLPVLFAREIDATQMNMAVGEAIAHLNYLVFGGRMERTIDGQGAYRYRTLDESVRERIGREHQRDPLPLEV